MFESVSTPAFAGELRALRFSLNSPVVAIGGLPAGPTSAAVALHVGSEGGRLSLALRSLRTGDLIVFEPDEEWREIHGTADSLDAALAFAEGLGFLFDEDPFEAGGDRQAAARRWAELVGAGAAPPVALAEEELWLEEIVPAAPPPGRGLSKFRLRGARRGARRLETPAADPARASRERFARLLSRF